MSFSSISIGGNQDFGHGLNFTFADNHANAPGVTDPAAQADAGAFSYGDTEINVDNIDKKVTFTDKQGQQKEYSWLAFNLIDKTPGGWVLTKNTDSDNTIKGNIGEGPDVGSIMSGGTVNVGDRSFDLIGLDGDNFKVQTYKTADYHPGAEAGGGGISNQVVALDATGTKNGNDGKITLSEYDEGNATPVDTYEAAQKKAESHRSIWHPSTWLKHNR